MIPLELPVRAGEAAVLADLILQLAEKKTLNDELRQRIASRGAALKLESMTPYYGSLQKDPSHQSAYYLAVDGLKGEPLMLRMAPAASPTSALFPQAILIGRMRPGSREIVVNAVPFDHTCGEAIRRYVEQVDPAVLPRPQGPQSAISCASVRAELDMPEAFAAFRSIQKKSGINVASVSLMDAATENAGRFYESTLWAAIRAGWRDGYNMGLRVGPGGKAVIQEAAGYTRFVIDVSPVEERTDLPEDDGAWCVNEFSRTFSAGEASIEFTSDEIVELASRFHRALTAAEETYDYIRLVKSQNRGRAFDFELAVNAVTPRELLFCLHWLKSRGRPAQMFSYRGGDWNEMTAVARSCNATITVTDAEIKPAARWNCTVARPEDIVEAWDRLRAQ